MKRRRQQPKLLQQESFCYNHPLFRPGSAAGFASDVPHHVLAAHVREGSPIGEYLLPCPHKLVGNNDNVDCIKHFSKRPILSVTTSQHNQVIMVPGSRRLLQIGPRCLDCATRWKNGDGQRRAWFESSS